IGSFDHPSEGSFPALRNPLRFDGFDDPQTGTPPLLGSDTDAILAGTLGLDEAEVAALRKDGVV
ncbi:hypothetical protein, partial [Enterobacter hormaechei]|uniref:hypothetical protein n=1 Tax=Enterobacter hormaechei TaxID=158836 RepID=UPI0019546B98